MKVLHSVTMALPLAAMMLFAQSQTTPDPSRSGQKPGSSQTDHSAQSGQSDRSGQSGQADRSGQSGQSQSGAQPGARSGQSSATPSSKSTQAADRTSSGAAMTFTGTIVNADCAQAQALINRTSGSFADRSASSTSSTPAAGAGAQAESTAKSGAATARNQKSVYDLQRDVMRRCPASERTTDLALLTDDGRFFKLDDAGTTQVKTEAGKNIKNMKVTINGSLEGDTLKVQSVTRKTGA